MLVYGITKTGDSDNSHIDSSDHVAIYDDGEYVQFTLMNPEREFSVRFKDLHQVLQSIKLGE